jgi:hypothetical protein
MDLRRAGRCRLLSFGGVLSLCLLGCSPEPPLAPSSVPALGATANVPVAHATLDLRFEKTGGDQAGPILTWTGIVLRDDQVFGDLTTTTDVTTWTPRGASGKAFDVTFDFTIDSGASTMVLELSGLLNLPAPGSEGPGLVNMNGIVRTGTGAFAPLVGAQVHEQGRLVGISNGATSWAGTIRIAAGSAGS